jgi:hypothetical protein
MDRFASLRGATLAAIVESAGTTSNDLRRRLVTGEAPPDLAALVEKIRTRAYTISDDDLSALQKVYSDDQLFEIIVATTFGSALDRVTAAHKALEIA